MQQEPKAPVIKFRIADVVLDGSSLTARSTDIEMERHKAVSDLLAENSFELLSPVGTTGAYHLKLTLDTDRLHMRVHCRGTDTTEILSLPLTPLKKLIHDYVILCDNFYKTAREGQIHRLEAIDAGRRSIHDEAAELLAESLQNKVNLDKLTARRLFSLLYVLHMRGTDVM
ncbi:MAG TPA: UPF0262 family protein [Alphaproteobacteria bacterium]|jgi:uncharacterized protein (UPF0262 family)|nr:UPF0262 family protein [Alphaproteobacteria bacterium]